MDPNPIFSCLPVPLLVTVFDLLVESVLRRFKWVRYESSESRLTFRFEGFEVSFLRVSWSFFRLLDKSFKSMLGNIVILVA